MSEPIEGPETRLAAESEDPPLGETVPKPPTGWHKVRNWLFATLLLFMVSTVVDKAAGFVLGTDPEKTAAESAKETGRVQKLRGANQYVKDSVTAVHPFDLAWTFYDYLFSGNPPEAVRAYVFAQPVPDSTPVIAKLIYRAIPGAVYTALAMVFSGWIGFITATIALLLGYMVVNAGPDDDSDASRFFFLLLIPLVGGVFVWVLLQFMDLATYAFDGILNWPGVDMWFSCCTITTWAMFKKTENDFTDKFINRMTKRIFG